MHILHSKLQMTFQFIVQSEFDARAARDVRDVSASGTSLFPAVTVLPLALEA